MSASIMFYQRVRPEGQKPYDGPEPWVAPRHATPNYRVDAVSKWEGPYSDERYEPRFFESYFEKGGDVEAVYSSAPIGYMDDEPYRRPKDFALLRQCVEQEFDGSEYRQFYLDFLTEMEKPDVYYYVSY